MRRVKAGEPYPWVRAPSSALRLGRYALSVPVGRRAPGSGWKAGLEALAREDVPPFTLTAERFREAYLPRIWVPGALEEIEYPGLVRELLGEFDVRITDAELERFLAAEHAAWNPAREMGVQSHALLDSLRDRGVKV